jgi:hypothetical protein
MSRRVISIFKNYLVIQLNHLVFVAAAISSLGLLSVQRSYWLLWVLAVVVPIGMYVARVKTNTIVSFFAYHILFLVAGLIVPVSILPKLILIAMMIVYFVLSFRKKITETPELLDQVSPAAFVIVIGAMTFKNHAYVSQCVAIAWIYLVLYFLMHFLSVHLYFVEIQEQSASNMPEQELLFQGLKQVGVFTGITCFFAAIASNPNWISKILDVLKSWVMVLLKAIFSGVSEGIIEESAQSQPAPDGSMGDMLPKAEYSELWLRILEILEVVYDIIIFILIVGIIYFGIRSAIRFVKENFGNANKRNEAKKILSNQDIRESCRTEVKKKSRKSFLGFLNNEQRIRTIYKKKVLREKDKIIGEKQEQALSYFTAKECCEKMEASLLKEAYEKARYSGQEITSEDVRSVKNS